MRVERLKLRIADLATLIENPAAEAAPNQQDKPDNVNASEGSRTCSPLHLKEEKWESQ